MTDMLHVFAVDAGPDIRHTHLTRARGEAVALPPLDTWLGTAVDPDEIELFPVKDIAEMPLSDYVSMAFAPAALPADDARRLNALEGHVLIVPDRALSGAPVPAPQVTPVARLPLARPDQSASLPKADVTPTPRPAATPVPKARRSGGLPWLLAAGVLLGLFLVLLVT